MTHKKIACLFGVILMLMGVFALPCLASSNPSVTITKGEWQLNYATYPNVTEFTRLTFDFVCDGTTYNSMVFNPSNSRLIYYKGSTATTVRNGQTWTDTKYQTITIKANTTISASGANQVAMATWLQASLHTIQDVEHTIEIFTPQFYQHPNTGKDVYEWKSFDVYYGYPWNEANEPNYYEILITRTDTASSSGFTSVTVIDIWEGTAPSETKSTYTITTHNTMNVVSGVTYRENGSTIPLEEISSDMGIDGVITTKYIYSREVVVESNKDSTFKLYLVQPEHTYIINEQTVTDQELIDQTIKEAGGLLEMGTDEMWNGLFNQYGAVPINTVLARASDIMQFAWNSTPDWVTGVIVSIVALGLTIKAVGMLV